MPATWQIDPSQASNLGSNRVARGPELSGLLGAGDEVLYRNGFYHDGNGVDGFLRDYLELDNLTIGNYGSGLRAQLDPRVWLPAGSGGWTLVRTTGGKKAYRSKPVASPTAALRRLWIGAQNNGIEIGARFDGLSLGRPPGSNGGLDYDIEDSFGLADEATVLDRLFAANTEQGRLWCSLVGSVAADRVVYMIVPSLSPSDTPDNWYGGIALLQVGGGSAIGGASPAGLRFRNCANVLVDGLNIGGGAAALQVAPNTTKATTGLTVRNCDLTYWWSRGLQVNGSGSFGNSSILLEDLSVDAKPTEDEQEPRTGKGWFGGAESIEATSNAAAAPLTNFTLRRTTVRGLQHNAINVAPASNGAGGVVSGILIEFNTVIAEDWETDVRPMAVHGISGPASGNLVRGNVFKNCCTEAEFSGQLKVLCNWWLGMRRSVSQPTLSTCVRLGPNGDRDQATTALEFSYNQLLGCPETPIRILAGKENIPAGGITVAWNLLQMVGSVTDVAWNIRNNFSAYSFATDAIRLIGNHVERANPATLLWRTTGSSAQVSNGVGAGPSGGSGADAITYIGNTTGTRLTPIPSSVYPPPAAVPMFG